MNQGEYEGIIGRLDAILGKMPAVPQPDPRSVASTPVPPAVVDRGGPLGAAGQRGASRALARLLDALDGWIEGARANHDALDHRGENIGDECWTRFHPSDIRAMVNDAAREVGVAEPWTGPTPSTPEWIKKEGGS